MATAFLSTATTYFPAQTVKKLTVTLCKSSCHESPIPSPILTKRSLAISLTTALTLSITASNGLFNANAAILEADDDLELLEKVKKDRKKRLEQQGVISSSDSEKATLQELVYKLSKVGQAIENNDLTVASSVLGSSTDNDWVRKVGAAFTKLSSSSDEMSEVDTFNASLATLISSVARNDVNSSKLAFLSSAVALEKWSALTGLVEQLKGL